MLRKQCNAIVAMFFRDKQDDDEDFILSDRLEREGFYETITENGVHYGVEVFGKIFDNLSRQGLSPKDWVKDFTSPSNEFEVEVIEEF